MPQKQAVGTKLVSGKMPVWMNVATRLQFARLSSEGRDATIMIDLKDEKSASLAAAGDPKSYVDAIIGAELAAASRLQDAPLQQLVYAVEQLVILAVMFACDFSMIEPVPPATSLLLERCRELLKMKRISDDLKLFAKAAAFACTAAMERSNGALQQAIQTLDRAILLLTAAEEGSSGLNCKYPFMVNKSILQLQLGRFDTAVETLRCAVSGLASCIKSAVLREDSSLLHANVLELGIAYFNLGLAHELARQTSLAFEAWREGLPALVDMSVVHVFAVVQFLLQVLEFRCPFFRMRFHCRNCCFDRTRICLTTPN
jgi:tetratricopeptide (TPR) repeat protein